MTTPPTGLKTSATDVPGRTVGVLTSSTHPLKCCSAHVVPTVCRGSSREQPTRIASSDIFTGVRTAAALAAGGTHLRRPGVAPCESENGERRARAVAPACCSPRGRSRLCRCGVDRDGAMPLVRLARIATRRARLRRLNPGPKRRPTGGQ
jgi:hypothetical protein